nr:MAG TPA: hypothetical protein [Caudoviricetes sp.]
MQNCKLSRFLSAFPKACRFAVGFFAALSTVYNE